MAFISTAIIDPFDRPDSASLGLQWGATISGGANFAIASGRCVAAAGLSTCASLWQEKYEGDMEAWVDVMTLPTGTGSFQLILGLASRAGAGLADTSWVGGYGLIYTAVDNQLNLAQFRNASITNQVVVTWTFGTGVRIGIARIGSALRGYTWTPAAGPTQILAYNGNPSGGLPWGGGGYNGLRSTTSAGGVAAEFDNFGGGQTPYEVRTKRRRSRMTNWS